MRTERPVITGRFYYVKKSKLTNLNKGDKTMAIKMTVAKHTVAEPSGILARDYGAHMVSLNIKEDTDNGRIVKVGKMSSLDLYEVEEATEINAYIAMKNPNGTWLVVVDDVADGKTAFIYQKPLIAHESPRALTAISNFYNDPADGAVRGYILQPLDRFSLSNEGFVGTPKEGATITSISDGKLVIATA